MKCKILILIIILLSLTNQCISSNHLDKLIITKNIYESIKHLNPDINITTAKQISESVFNNSNTHNLSWKVIVAIINTESEFDKNAKSNGCYGLMQVNLSAHYDKLKELKLSKQDLFHIKNNINLGCIILKEYVKNSKNLNYALKKYCGGNTKYVKKVNITISKITTHIKKGI